MRRRHAISEPREPQYWQQPIDEGKRATDDNGCRWEWKFSLDADQRPELSCRCRTCGVKYYLSSWHWTLDRLGCEMSTADGQTFARDLRNSQDRLLLKTSITVSKLKKVPRKVPPWMA
jgi:hypothetical protein